MRRNVGAMRGGLIVSCQVEEGTMLGRPDITAGMADAAVRGGAVGVRVRGIDDVRAVKVAVLIPVIGLTKRHFSHSPVYITPTWDDVAACTAAGADIVALDATDRPRPDGLTVREIVQRVRATSDVLLMADVAQLSEGEQAAALGFDLVSTTLAGYTGDSFPMAGPDFALLSALAQGVDVPVVAEGRFTTPEQAKDALQCGAWAVCVGKAITDPEFITGQFIRVLSNTSGAVP